MYNCTANGQIFMDSPAGSGFKGSYSVDTATGQINGTTVLAPGSGYSVLPTLRISDPACRCGSSIEAVNIVSGGSGLTDTGSITAQSTSTVIARSFSGTFTAQFGSLKSIKVVSSGYGFTNQNITWVFKCQNSTSSSSATLCTPTQNPTLFAVIGKPGNVGGNSDLCLKFHWASGAKIAKQYKVTNISFILRNGLIPTSTGNETANGANVTANITGTGISIHNTGVAGNVLNFIQQPSFWLKLIGSTSTIRGDRTTLFFAIRPNSDLLPVIFLIKYFDLSLRAFCNVACFAGRDDYCIWAFGLKHSNREIDLDYIIQCFQPKI